MSLPAPWTFHPAFAQNRLEVIAEALLNLRHQTLRELHSEYDDNYTREAVVFGRSRNLLINMALYGRLGWFSLLNPAMDVTVAIDNLPVRFFRDDPDRPEKQGFFKRNAVDDLFEPEEGRPVMWRFVVERAETQYDEDQVHFVGFNVFQEKVSQWIYRAGASTVHGVNAAVPKAAELGAPVVDLRDDEQGRSDAAASG